MTDARLSKGDVVQLTDTRNLGFAGCMLIVTEVKAWGVQGYVQLPGTRTAFGPQAYYRAETHEFKRIGRAVFQVPA